MLDPRFHSPLEALQCCKMLDGRLYSPFQTLQRCEMLDSRLHSGLGALAALQRSRHWQAASGYRRSLPTHRRPSVAAAIRCGCWHYSETCKALECSGQWQARL